MLVVYDPKLYDLYNSGTIENYDGGPYQKFHRRLDSNNPDDLSLIRAIIAQEKNGQLSPGPTGPTGPTGSGTILVDNVPSQVLVPHSEWPPNTDFAGQIGNQYLSSIIKDQTIMQGVDETEKLNRIRMYHVTENEKHYLNYVDTGNGNVLFTIALVRDSDDDTAEPPGGANATIQQSKNQADDVTSLYFAPGLGAGGAGASATGWGAAAATTLGGPVLGAGGAGTALGGTYAPITHTGCRTHRPHR